VPKRWYSFPERIAALPPREREVEAHAGLDAGLLVGAEDVVVLAKRPSFPFPLVEVQDPAVLPGEARVAGEDPRPVLPGLDGVVSEPTAHGGRRGRGSDASAAAWRARSGRAQRARGVPLAAGISHVSAFTSATTAVGNLRGLPGRGASASPPVPCSQYGAATCGPCPRRCPASRR
jgi:hypothetical protein